MLVSAVEYWVTGASAAGSSARWKVVTAFFPATPSRLNSFVLASTLVAPTSLKMEPGMFVFFLPLPSVNTNGGAIHHAAAPALTGAGGCYLQHISVPARSPRGKERKTNWDARSHGRLVVKIPSSFPTEKLSRVVAACESHQVE